MQGDTVRYLSVCSGIEAVSVAWEPLGFTPAAFSEIEPFPRAVLEHRFPSVPLHGDFTTIGASDYGPIDIVCGGTPCQSFSVAGLRGGMADDRGNLALEFCRLALRTRPRWVVWENVPGVLSSWSDDPDCTPEETGGFETVQQRNDFDCFVEGMAECGYFGAWRTLDAQFTRVQSHPFAVPQRRRRVFFVGYLGDWRPPAAVLFERESLRGHSPPRRETGQDVTESLAGRTSGGGGLGTDFECDGGLIARDVARSIRAQSNSANTEDADNYVVPINKPNTGLFGSDLNRKGIGSAGDPAFTLTSDDVQAVAFNQQAGGTQTTLGFSPERANALAANQVQGVMVPAVSPAMKARDSKVPSSDGSGGEGQSIHRTEERGPTESGQDLQREGMRSEIARPRPVRDAQHEKETRGESGVSMAVRRLTPL